MARTKNSHRAKAIKPEADQILSKRIQEGQIEYFIKWKEQPDSANSWVPSGELSCKDLIAAFEELQAKNNENTQEASGETILGAFGQGFSPEKIIDAHRTKGELMFLMKWKDKSESLVLAKEARIKCPLIVIDFYESNLKWKDE